MAEDSGQASAEIKPTAEMVEEGWSALLDWDSRDFPDRVMVIDVFKAMIEAASPDWIESLSASAKCRQSL